MSKMTTIIESNKYLECIEAAKQYMDNSHGSTLIAYSLISENNKKLEITVKYPSMSSMNYSLQSMLGALLINKENKVMLRSYNIDGEFKSKHGEINLSNDISLPNTDMFGSVYKIILDISIIASEQIWTFYRLYDADPRIFKCTYK